MGIDHTRDKAVWQLIGRGRDRVPDAARALQVRSYLVAALEHLWLCQHRVTKPPYRRGQYHRASPRPSAAILRTVSAVILMRISYPV
jgi:hypothetical protein